MDEVPPIGGALGRLSRWVMARPRQVLASAVALGLAAALVGLPPDVNPNMLDLLPADLPAAKAIKELGDNHIPAGLWLTFEGDEADTLDAVLDDVVDDLEQLDRVAFAVHKIEPELATHLALMQIEPAAVEEADGRIRMALALGPALSPILASQLLDLPDMSAANRASVWTPDDGLGRIFVRPSESHHDPAFAMKVVSDLEQAIASADLESRGVRMLFLAGPYAVIADSASGIRDDLLRTTVISAGLVLLVLMLGLRSLRAPVLLFPPLVLAALLHLAAMYLVLGALNANTVMGTAILFGLGIDFSIHLVSRAREELAQGRSLEDAVATAWDYTGPACIFAGLTSAAGFSALGLSRFAGLSQLAFALTAGVLLALVSVLVLLPALIAIQGGASFASPMVRGRDEARPSLGFGLGSGRDEARPSLGWARLAVPVLVIATVAAGWFASTTLHFEHDFTQLGRTESRFELMSDRQQELTRQAAQPVLIPVTAEQRAPEQARLRALIEAGELPHVRSVLSVDDLLPPDQPRRVAALTTLRTQLDHPNLRYLPPPVVKRLLPLRDWEPRERTGADLPEGVRFLLGNGELLVLPVAGNSHDMLVSGQLLDELAEHAPNAASELALQGALYRTVIEDIPRFSVLALILVAILTIIDLRRPVLCLVALGSLLTGVVWAGFALAIAQIPLTLSNVLGLPVLLGLGVDAVLHMMHRLADGASLDHTLRTVGPAAVLSTATTVASFSSLCFASTGTLSSLGQLVTVGLVAVTLMAMSTLALLWLARRSDGSAQAPP